MNEQYKQWKKVLAGTPIRISLIVLMYVGAILLTNFFIHVLHFLQVQGNLLRVSGMDAFAQVGQNFEFLIRNFFRLFTFPALNQGGQWFPEQLYYVFSLLFTTLVGWKLPYTMYRAYVDINKGSKGTARWTTNEELDAQYPVAPLSDERYEGLSGVPVRRVQGQEKVYIDTMNTNSRAVAESQSGKTQTWTIPFIHLVARASIQDSMVINDLKGSMYRGLKNFLEKLDYKVFCFNLILPTHSIGYNPLQSIQKAYFSGEIGSAEKQTKAFAYKVYHNKESKDPVWQEGAQALVSAVILAICRLAKEKNRPQWVNLACVFSFIQILGKPMEDGSYLMDRYFDQFDLATSENKQYTIFRTSEIKQRSSFLITVLSKLQQFLGMDLEDLLTSSEFDFEDLGFGEQPIALFVIFPDSDDSDYLLLSLFYSQLLSVLAQSATKSATGKLKRRVRIILEEAMNMPAIEGLSRGMNINLERGILTHLVYQAEGQADKVYGEEAKALRAACGNSYFIMSSDWEDTEGFVKKLGESTIITYNRAGDPLARDKSYTEMEEQRNLMMADEAMRLREGEWLLMRTKHRRDLEGNPTRPYPVFANVDEDTQMYFAYQYLPHLFNHTQGLEQMAPKREKVKDKSQFRLDETLLLDIVEGKKIEEAGPSNQAYASSKAEETPEHSSVITQAEALEIREVVDQNTHKIWKEEVQSLFGIETSVEFQRFEKVEELHFFIQNRKNTLNAQPLFKEMQEVLRKGVIRE